MEHAGDGDAPRRTPEGPEDRLRAVVGGTPQHPHAPHAPPSDAARRDAPGAGPDAARPMSESERNSVRVTSGPAGALAGAAAGATAGLVSGPFGPIAAGIGAIVGAVVGGSMGAVSGQAVANPQFGAAEDAHYRALYEGSADRTADRGYEHVRPAYQFGHLAAHHAEWTGRDFGAAEPELQRAWDGELRGRHGEWTTARRHVADAWGHARAEGAGARREAAVLGSAGSAVDPVELERARAGAASVEPGVAHGTVAPDTRTMGGTETHHRAEFSDPLPTSPLGPPGAGTPGWMARPTDQGGGGAHLADSAEAGDGVGRDARDRAGRPTSTDPATHDRDVGPR